MNIAVGGIGGNSSMMMQGMGRMQRPDPSKMAEDLFSKLDTGGKGYIEKSDIQAAFQSIPTSSSTSADDVFASLDGDSDGKVTQQEMSDSIKKLSDALDSQFQSMRMGRGMGGGMGGMGGMRKGGDDAGFTQEQLSVKLESIAGTTSNGGTMLSGIIDNFDKVDTNGDGKVSAEEAGAYRQATQSATATANGGGDAQVMMQIMDLARAYGLGGSNATGAGLSLTA
ncbi:MAG: EF-hand domain-containing protein [Gammaproteobacteria bacterium]|nr:EF-hand domain-containing protein [Gammaproteobacteria bacterium]MBU1646450.1 EF-hand domain-containing protein [Gammaproteobacteria bacterium]MBU1970993.1 EF-hand domain-containing protein [Gammaproteobacteria bacterium]